MPDDGGFERDMVNGLNDLTADKKPVYYTYRRKQSRFSSQDIDVLSDSRKDKYFAGIECKSKQIDVEKSEKDGNEAEAKLYYSQAFSTNKDGEHQIDRIHEWLNKTGRRGILAIAYRRGRGRTVHYYAIDFEKVYEHYEKDDTSGLPKSFVEEEGILLQDADSKQNVKRGCEVDWARVFET